MFSSVDDIIDPWLALSIIEENNPSVQDPVFRLNLDVSGESWITIQRLPQELREFAHKNFTDLFKLHPVHKSSTNNTDKTSFKTKFSCKKNNLRRNDGKNQKDQGKDQDISTTTNPLTANNLPLNDNNNNKNNNNNNSSLDTDNKDEGLSSVIVYNTDLSAHRWYQSYLNTPPYIPSLNHDQSYMFASLESIKQSKMSEARKQLPDLFQPFFDYLNNNFIQQQKNDKEKNKTDDNNMVISDENNYSNNNKTTNCYLEYNQAVANWYENHRHYLPCHSDWHLHHCSQQINPHYNIATITFNAPNTDGSDETISQCRTFMIKPKTNYKDESVFKSLKLITRHGVIIKMYGLTQEKFIHGIPEENDKDKDSYQILPRISLTCRTFDTHDTNINMDDSVAMDNNDNNNNNVNIIDNNSMN